MDIKRFVFRSFKSNGLSLSADASTALQNVLSRDEDKQASINNILSLLRERIEKQEIKSSIIDYETIRSVVADLSSSSEDLELETIQLIDAFSSPKLEYDLAQKSYKISTEHNSDILGGVGERAAMYRERLQLGQQRLLRSGKFILKGMGVASTGQSASAPVIKHELSTIESMLGSSGAKVLFGILTQPEEGVWFLEDLGSMVELDLSHVTTKPLLYTEGSVVVIQGELHHGGVFKVHAMGLPPAEYREASLESLGLIDTLNQNMRQQQLDDMLQLEQTATNTVMVVMSDLKLDRPLVLEKLQQVFDGFEANGIDPFFVLMGSFLSKPISRMSGGRGLAKATFSSLADVIASCPRLAQNAKFLIIPGPTDPGSSVCLPRRRVPAEFVETLQQKVRHIAFGSNPFRVRFYTQEIVFFREDLLKKMQRHLATTLQVDSTMTKDDGDDDRDDEEGGNGRSVPDITEQLVESLLDQAHLFPLPPQAKPVLWNLDHTMRLFPLPNLLILADHADHYSYEYKGCSTLNPGSFSSDYSFVVYHPSTGNIEFSRVP